MSKQRMLLLSVSTLAYLIFLSSNNTFIGGMLLICLAFLCIVVLYRNLTKLTYVEESHPAYDTMKNSVIFSLIILVLGIIAAILVHFQIIKPGEQEELTVAVFVVIVILGLGHFAPKIPFNRHIGLRLPWTVMDEDAWNVANQLLGYLSYPISAIYLIALPLYGNLETLTLYTIVAWIGIPAIASLIKLILKSKAMKR